LYDGEIASSVDFVRYYVMCSDFLLCPVSRRSRDSSVGVASYELDGRVQFPAEVRFFLVNAIQTGSEAYTTSYPMSTMGSFPGGKSAGA
jgi:hypothetical protein